MLAYSLPTKDCNYHEVSLLFIDILTFSVLNQINKNVEQHLKGIITHCDMPLLVVFCFEMEIIYHMASSQEYN